MKYASPSGVQHAPTRRGKDILIDMSSEVPLPSSLAPENLPGDQDTLPRTNGAPSAGRELETEFSRQVFESIKDFAILTLDLAGVVTSWNPGAARIFGYTASEIIGQQGGMLWTPEDQARGAATQEREDARRDGMAEDKRWHQRKDGSLFFANGTMRPLFDETGALQGFTKVCRDATAENEAQERLGAIVESSDDAIISKNLRSVVTSWNIGAQRIFGYTAEEMIGKSIHVLIPPERWGEEDGILSKISRGERVDHLETVRVAKDGRRLDLSVTISPVRDLSGKVVGASKVARDITERKQAEVRQLETERAARAQAEHASRMKDEFLATLSHELRTPLNAILGWSQILRDDPSAEDIAQGVAVIERNARAQTQIIEDLLDMSRIISGKVRLDVQRVDLKRVVEAAIDTVRAAADAKAVRLQIVLDPLARPVSGDPNRLQQVFWNLLSNAIKFTPKNGRVQVVLERVNSHLEVSVSDSGEGISPEFLPHVFDRFRQQDATTARQHGGLGLGLAIVKQLTELHGGTVRVKSGGPGQGATFTVALPLSALHQEPEPEGERRHPRGTHDLETVPLPHLKLAGVKILAVDDEPDARELVRRLLGGCEAIVRTAGSAAEALAMIRVEAPDVLVSDIGMPGQDGYALIRQVRALDEAHGGNVPAVALTAYARSEDRMKAILAGFQMHVAKPVEGAELITVVASLAGRTSNH